jgi:hypothetical protein
MSADSLKNALAGLQAASQMSGDGAVAALDAALQAVTAHHSAASIGPILMMLNDSAEHDEGMFSLIHAAEAFDDAEYVPQLLKALPELQASAPRWASIVLMRVLNSESARDVLVRALRESAPATKQAAKWLCERVNERGAQFTSKTMPVLLAAGT